MKKLLLIFVLVMTIKMVWAQPANDLCTGAITLLDDGSCVNGSSVASTDNITGEAGCATPGAAGQHLDVWYSFTANYTEELITVTAATFGTVEVLLATGTCTALTLVASNCGASPLNATFTNLTVGTTYTIILSAPGNATGSFDICVTGSEPPILAGQDCASAEPICSNSSFGGNSSGFGVQELPNNNTVDGCLTTEHQSSWYTFQIGTSGVLELTISPATTVDYDFAIWGPNVSCPMSTSPIRCSWAADNGDTGLSASDSDVSETFNGNGFLAPLTVVAGQTYYLLIDNFTANSASFDLNWGGTAVLNCAVLPVEMLWFRGIELNDGIELSWATASENNNYGFHIERSSDQITYQVMGFVEGKGFSNELSNYKWKDESTDRSMTWMYRLSQVDFNGTFKHYYLENAISSNIIKTEWRNLQGQQVLSPTNGLFIKSTYYSNGDIKVEKICFFR
ncbi:MAG: hypothetical protein ACOVOO_03515 [Flavobacteriales bacterium]